MSPNPYPDLIDIGQKHGNIPPRLYHHAPLPLKQQPPTMTPNYTKTQPPIQTNKKSKF